MAFTYCPGCHKRIRTTARRHECRGPWRGTSYVPSPAENVEREPHDAEKVAYWEEMIDVHHGEADFDQQWLGRSDRRRGRVVPDEHLGARVFDPGLLPIVDGIYWRNGRAAS